MTASGSAALDAESERHKFEALELILSTQSTAHFLQLPRHDASEAAEHITSHWPLLKPLLQVAHIFDDYRAA